MPVIADLLQRYPRTLGWYVVVAYTAAMMSALWPG